MATIPDPATTEWVPIWNPLTEGPVGPAGPAGPQGDPGPAGTAAVVWTPYTVTWLGQTANPALGNGFQLAKYAVIGHVAHFQIIIGTGSTTTYGTGTWGFTLPLPVVGHALGTVWIYDGGNGLMYPGTLGSGAFIIGGAFANAVVASVAQGAPPVNATAPIAWAARVPSYLFLQGTYEIAAAATKPAPEVE